MQMTIIEQALGEPLDQALAACCQTLSEQTTPEEQARAIEYVNSIRTEFLATCRDVDDEQELDYIAAIKFIETKSVWIMLNTKINYQTVFRGEADGGTVLLGSLVSQLLVVLEPLLDPNALEQITNFLSEPMNRSTVVTTDTQRLFDELNVTSIAEAVTEIQFLKQKLQAADHSEKPVSVHHEVVAAVKQMDEQLASRMPNRQISMERQAGPMLFKASWQAS